MGQLKKSNDVNKTSLFFKYKLFNRLYIYLTILFGGWFLYISDVYAKVSKLEGGNITIDSLGTIIKDLATKIQVFGIIAAFAALILFTIQFIIGDDDTKQRRKKTILYTLLGVALLILVPSIINFIIDTLE